jgi:hypothetical protein
LKQRLLDEAKSFLFITLYFWAVMTLLNLHKNIVLGQNAMDYKWQGFTIVNALVLAKVVAAADYLRLGNRFGERPLIFAVLYKSVIFAVVLIAFHICEGLALAWLQARPLSESLAQFGRGDLRGVVSMWILVSMALVPFFMCREVAHVIGDDQLWRLFFDRGARSFRLVQG